MQIRQKLTHFSPASESTLHLLCVPATGVMQDISEIQKEGKSVEVDQHLCIIDLMYY